MVAPTVEYAYSPEYGVETYLPPGNGIAGRGGAEETNDNLLVTLWRPVPGSDPFTPGELFGELVVPYYANGDQNNPPQNIRPAFRTGMKSRVASKFYFRPEENPPASPWPFSLAVLNPPQEYKQQIAGAIKRVGDVPDLFTPPVSPDFLEITKPLDSIHAWSMSFDAAPVPFVNFLFGSNGSDPPDPAFVGYIYSTLFNFGGSDVLFPFPTGIPFLKTNGANGVAPEFFDNSTNDGFDEMIEAINRGAFYVLMILIGDPWGDENGEEVAFPGHITISWPGSPSRR